MIPLLEPNDVPTSPFAPPPGMTMAEREAAIAAITTKVADIPPFSWSSDHAYYFFVHNQDIQHMPPAAKPYVGLETEWVEDPFTPEQWREQDAIAVGLNKMECPVCHGNHTVQRSAHGKVTGLHITQPRSCMCKFYRLFYSRWLDAANVPSGYRNVRLENLKTFASNFSPFTRAREGTVATLDQLIDTATRYQHNCYLLVGPAGTGKTTLMTAMYHRALVDWAYISFKYGRSAPAVWKVNATTLAAQFREWDNRPKGDDADKGSPVPLPEVTQGKVMAAIRAGLVPCLFIDELDKFKMDSSYQATKFAEVISLIQENGGQVFASSNLGYNNLCAALGSQFGPSILRRLCGPRMDASSTIVDNPEVGGFLIDFWEGKITQNYKVDAPQYEKPLPSKKVWVPEAEYRAQRNRSQNYAQASPHTGYSTGTPREATDKQSSSAVTLPSFPASPQPRKSITLDGTYPASK